MLSSIERSIFRDSLLCYGTGNLSKWVLFIDYNLLSDGELLILEPSFSLEIQLVLLSSPLL
jgi:hypothetical protein